MNTTDLHVAVACLGRNISHLVMIVLCMALLCALQLLVLVIYAPPLVSHLFKLVLVWQIISMHASSAVRLTNQTQSATFSSSFDSNLSVTISDFSGSVITPIKVLKTILKKSI